MASIYEKRTWQSSDKDLPYLKNTAVWRPSCNKFYYNISDITTPATNWDPCNNSATSNKYWGGHTNHNGVDKPHFFWKPSYNLNISKAPVVKSIRFGDGYEQRIEDGINHNLNIIDLKFENRSLIESTAILHFLEHRGGTESFVFTPPPPYARASLYVCRNWDSSYVFYDNYSIKMQLEEVPE